MRTLLYAICVVLFASACQSGENKAEKTVENTISTPADAIPLDSFLIGTWENLSLEIKVNSANHTDSTYSVLIPAGEWENKLGVKPIRTTYDTNNTYRSEYRTLTDSVFKVTRGIWNVFGDTLLLIEPEGTYEYQVRYRDSLAEFSALLDWDGDGKADDSYRGLQKKRIE